jgi:hypothetical protein
LSKVTLQRITSFHNDVSAPAAFNANMTLLESVIDTLLSRDGTSPNTMSDDLDMNSQRILNLPTPISDLEPVTQAQLDALVLSVTTPPYITNGSVVEAHLATGAVTTGKIADLNVTSGKLADNAVTNAKMADNSVNTAELVNSGVTLAKLANLTANSVIGNNTGGSATPTAITMADLATALAPYFSTAVAVGSVLWFPKSSPPTGYLTCDGSTVSRATYSALYSYLNPSSTVTAAADDTITWNSHNLQVNDRVMFTTTGVMPTGLGATTWYYVRDVTTNTFKVALTAGGTAVDITSTGTGTLTCQHSNWGLGDYITSFTLPDLRGEFIRGVDLGRGVDTNRSIADSQSHQFQTHTHSTSQFYYYVAGAGLYGVGLTGVGNPSTGAPNSGTYGSETRPRNRALLPCIKT